MKHLKLFLLFTMFGALAFGQTVPTLPPGSFQVQNYKNPNGKTYVRNAAKNFEGIAYQRYVDSLMDTTPVENYLPLTGGTLTGNNIPNISFNKAGIINWGVGNLTNSTGNSFTIGNNVEGVGDVITMTSDGYVGIGKSPSTKLDVAGNIRWGNGGYLGVGTSSIYNTSGGGTSLTPAIGTQYDFILYNGSGSGVFNVPTGTQDASFYHNVAANLFVGNLDGNALTATKSNALYGAGGTDVYGGTLETAGLSSILGIHNTGGIFKFTKEALNTFIGSPANGETLQTVTSRGNTIESTASGVRRMINFENKRSTDEINGTSLAFTGYWDQSLISSYGNPAQYSGGNLHLQTWANDVTLNEGILLDRFGNTKFGGNAQAKRFDLSYPDGLSYQYISPTDDGIGMMYKSAVSSGSGNMVHSFKGSGDDILFGVQNEGSVYAKTSVNSPVFNAGLTKIGQNGNIEAGQYNLSIKPNHPTGSTLFTDNTGVNQWAYINSNGFNGNVVGNVTGNATTATTTDKWGGLEANFTGAYGTEVVEYIAKDVNGKVMPYLSAQFKSQLGINNLASQYQPLENQRLGTSSSPIFSSLYTNSNLGVGYNYDTGYKLAVNGSSYVTNNTNTVLTVNQQAASLSNDSYTMLINSSAHNSNLSTAGAFAVNVNSGRAFTIDGKGHIGIGTAAPSEKLSVNGKIRAKEIKVENTNWPDYVFKSDYNLPTLQETEKHIKEKGHLPGIPSAAEVKANGIDLGEMNTKLLQKIEELTLHLIEKEKAINILINKVNLLEEKVR